LEAVSPASSAAALSPLILVEASVVPPAAECALREISLVALLYSSTAAAMAAETPEWKSRSGKKEPRLVPGGADKEG